MWPTHILLIYIRSLSFFRTEKYYTINFIASVMRNIPLSRRTDDILNCFVKFGSLYASHSSPNLRIAHKGIATTVFIKYGLQLFLFIEFDIVLSTLESGLIKYK